MLGEPKKFTVADFERMQHDLINLAARRFQAIVRKSRPVQHADLVDEFLRWDARLLAESRPGLVYEMWISFLPALVFPPEWKGSYTQEVLLKILEDHPNPRALAAALERAVRELETRLPHRDAWRWGVAHTLVLRHPLGESKFNLPPIPRGGDSTTVNASGRQGGTGASWREILDLADWDRSVMTNVPGESGDTERKHYRDLLDDWVAGRYHPLPFRRK